MRRSLTLVVLALIGFGFVSAAEAQLLRRLEQRLNQAAQAIGQPSDAAPLPAPGGDEPGYLGLSADDAGEAGRGARVVSVNEGSPAAEAGLRVGDLITAANGRPVTGVDDLADALKGGRVGTKVRFTVSAGERDKTLEVTLGRAATDTPPRPTPAGDSTPDLRIEAGEPSDEPPALEGRGNAVDDDDEAAYARPTLGMSVAPLSDEARTRYGITARRGALITAIRAGGPADQAGLPVGAVVVRMDGVRIDTADQLIDAVRTSRPGQELEIEYYNGDRLTRKSVRLGSAGPPPAGIPGPSPRTNRIDLGGGADRPLLRNLERAIGGIGAAPAADATQGGSEEASGLRREIDALRDQVQSLEERVRELEAKLTEGDGKGGIEPPALAPPR